jgi:hypothetical protein
MPTTFTKIASVSVGVLGAANIEFTSIPSTYTDLKVVQSCRTSGASYYEYLVAEFNGDTNASNYGFLYLYGNGATGSGITTLKFGGYANSALATSNTFSNGELYIPNYAGSNQKSFGTDSVAESNSSTTGQFMTALHAGSWSNTSAITSIKLIPNSGTFLQYSTATLYGINKS